MALIQTRGNAKIDSSVCTYSHTPMLTCPNCKECSGTCYAMKSYRQYPNVKKSWDSNFELSLYNPKTFVATAIQELKASKKAYCRIHVAGDFYSVDYINAWIEIASALPYMVFWTYTKAGINAAMRAALEKLNSLPNVNIVNSYPLGRINYGSLDYIQELARELSAAGEKCFICPCGTDDNVKCGKSCHACSVYKYVLFKQH